MSEERQNKGWWLAGIAAVALAAMLGVTRQSWMPGLSPVTSTEPASRTDASSAPVEGAADKSGAVSVAPSQEAAPIAASQSGQEMAGQEVAGQKVATAEPQQPAAVETKPAIIPAFDTVRVEKTGAAVIAGRAVPGSEVTVKFGDLAVGTALAGKDGTFVLVPGSPLPAGTGALTLESLAPGATVPVVSDESVAIMVPDQKEKSTPLVALVSPGTPTRVLQSPGAKATTSASPEPAVAPARGGLSLDAVDYDDAGNIVFSGRFTPGGTARIYVDNKPVGEAVAEAGGAWSYAGGRIDPGVHKLRVDGLDAKGQVVARVEVPFLRESSARVASAPATNPEAGPDQAANAAGNGTPVDAGTTKPGHGRVIIQPGNNLWTLATVIYGKGTKYTVLFNANKDLIRNPNLIYPGQIFTTPDATPPEEIDPGLRKPLESGGAAPN